MPSSTFFDKEISFNLILISKNLKYCISNFSRKTMDPSQIPLILLLSLPLLGSEEEWLAIVIMGRHIVNRKTSFDLGHRA